MEGPIFEWFPMWLAHIFRGFCILVGPFCIILSARLSRMHFADARRKFLFAGLSLLLAGIVYIEIDNWNAPVGPVLFFFTSGILISFIGLWKMKTYKDVQNE